MAEIFLISEADLPKGSSAEISLLGRGLDEAPTGYFIFSHAMTNELVSSFLLILGGYAHLERPKHQHA